LAFALDPRIEAASFPLAALPLSDLRLQNEARFTWFVLTPRRAGLRDLDELDPTEAGVLFQEIGRAARLVRTLMREAGRPCEKLNVAAIGNLVPQLHVHVLGRRSDDAFWPDPVWGRGPSEPLAAPAAESLLRRAGRLLLEDVGAAPSP
jgi:diadenosine tetraphosphate (Ap4A) HIT family hydrolase